MASIGARVVRNAPTLRNRLSAFWTPTGGITPAATHENDPHALLIRAGFLRQAYSGIFHLLPLGLRVQDKLQNLIDRNMESIGASKLCLSSISSPELWQKTGRLDKSGSELFHIQDRKNAGYLLSPTHEEEITTLVRSTIKSYKDLPLRLYQVGRKYRDELRPRQGLLRTKEFVMKDLYTFDVTSEAAAASYQDATKAYRSFFDELQVPYAVASADSGNIGGNLSHEYHFLTSHGEDSIISCTDCEYTANEEVAERTPRGASTAFPVDNGTSFGTWTGITKDKKTLVIVFYPQSTSQSEPVSALEAADTKGTVNTYALLKIVPQIDLSIENAVEIWSAQESDDPYSPRNITHVYDVRLSSEAKARLRTNNKESWIPSKLRKVYSKATSVQDVTATDSNGRAIDIMRIQSGDLCGHCSKGTLQVRRGIEVGHTFHLGTRYSEPLDAQVPTSTQKMAHLQMGCHGIGISRLIGAVAAVTSSPHGLRWPRAIAPYDVVIIVPGNGSRIENDVRWCYDLLANYIVNGRQQSKLREEITSIDGKATGTLSTNDQLLSKSVPGESYMDPIVDDRQKDIGWKLKDANLIGYPLIVLLGKSWSKDRLVEVKCPLLGSNDLVQAEHLGQHVAEHLLAYTENGFP